MMLGGDHRRELPNGRLGVNRPARHPKVRNRRVWLIPVRRGEGRLTEPTAATQPWQRELVLMPPFASFADRCINAPTPAPDDRNGSAFQ